MSEEEKKAIETLKEVASDEFDTLGDDISPKMAQNILNVIDNLQKEIEEKTTILLEGAKKVKQLEKEIKKLKEKIVDLQTKLAIETIDNKYNQEERDEETIPKYKIREKIKAQRQKYFDIHNGEHSINEICFESTKVEGAIEVLKELLGEDGDHIPRID